MPGACGSRGSFTKRRRLRGLPRWRNNEYLVGLVEDTRPLPNGDVLVRGRLRADVNRPQLQVGTTVTRPDGSFTHAMLVGPHFSVSAWPPRQSTVLRGVAEADLPPGTHLFASGEEEAAVVRGMAEGELRIMDRFGDVQVAGLLPREFMLANKTPDEVRNPKTT